MPPTEDDQMNRYTRQTDDEEFSTTDLALAAFLVASGHPLLQLGGLAGGRRMFEFPAQACEDARAFYRGASVGARSFANSLRDLKALLRHE
jgi:hypothetical protein